MLSIRSSIVQISITFILICLATGATSDSPSAKPEDGAKKQVGSPAAPPQNPGKADNIAVAPLVLVKPPNNFTAPKARKQLRQKGGASALRRRQEYGSESGGHKKGYGSNSGGEKAGDYGSSGSYGGDYSGEMNAYGHGYSLVDDYICDLDAAVLVVTNSEKKYSRPTSNGYGGGKSYGKGKPQSYGTEKADGYGEESNEEGGGGYGGQQEGGYGHADESNEEQGYSSGGGGSAYRRRRPKRGAYGGGEEKSGYGAGQQAYGKKTKKAYYNVAKAHRLRCSSIAVGSDEDCTTCCQLAARKDRSVARKSIIGFIIDYDEVRTPGYGGGENKQNRYKRDTDAYGGAQPPAYGPTDDYKKPEGSSYGYGSAKGPASYGSDDYAAAPSKIYSAPEKPYVAYPKCVCCAPKSRVDYGAKSYGANSYNNNEGYGSGNDNEGYGNADNEGYGSDNNEGYGKADNEGYGSGEGYGKQKQAGYGSSKTEGYGSGGKGYGSGEKGDGYGSEEAEQKDDYKPSKKRHHKKSQHKAVYEAADEEY